MTVYHLEFHKITEKELNKAANFYSDLESDLGDRFLDDVQIGLDHILDHCLGWPVQKGQARKKVLGRFPFSILFSVRKDTIYVLAIMNQSKRPTYWHDRL